MIHSISIRLALTAALAMFSVGALACSESMFTSGRALPFQTYMAPRPATILVFTENHDAQDGQADQLLGGLTKAGHHVLVVTDTQALARALDSDRYDVVITSYAQVDAVGEGTRSVGRLPTVIPVVTRSERKLASVRDRFKLFLVEGASLGQYLRAINRALAANAS